MCTNDIATAIGFTSRGLQLTTLTTMDPVELHEQWLVTYVAPGLHSADYTLLTQLSRPGGFIDRFVSLGGFAVINVGGDQSAPNVAPRGVGYTLTPLSNQDLIETATHGYITGEGFAGAQLDADSFLRWEPTDEGVLTNVPADATVVLRRFDDGPTWVEYNHGAGRVIVTTLDYCKSGPKSRGVTIENLLSYSRFYRGLAQTPGLTVTPTNTPTATATGPTRTPTSTRTPTFTREPTSTATPTEVPLIPLVDLIATLFDPNPPAEANINADARISVADVVALRIRGGD